MRMILSRKKRGKNVMISKDHRKLIRNFKGLMLYLKELKEQQKLVRQILLARVKRKEVQW